MSMHRSVYRFVVDAACDGLRIDTFLSTRLRNYASARIQRMAAAGLIRVNDEPCSPMRRVFRREEVTIRLAEPTEPFYPPEESPIEASFEDAWISVVNKPAGLIVHPAGPVGDGTLANVLQGRFDRQTRRPGLLRPGIVHRLDRETSGIVVIARCAVAHADLTRQFERGDVEKAYLAIVAGRVETAKGDIDRPIGRRADGLLMSADARAIDPRPAKTSFRVLRYFRTCTLLDVRPRTGRKHQIRVHLSAVGHPILGDVGYGGTRVAEVTRHALHAAAIAFRHPISNAPLKVVAQPPADFFATLRRT